MFRDHASIACRIHYGYDLYGALRVLALPSALPTSSSGKRYMCTMLGVESAQRVSACSSPIREHQYTPQVRIHK
jgi:hypothetical protein